MNNTLELSVLSVDIKASYDNSQVASLQQLTSIYNKTIPLQQRMLMQLIKQHQNQPGWIVLLAPDKEVIQLLAKMSQLPLHKVLVIHKQQLTKLNTVIHTTLSSGNCKVVINCGKALTDIDQQYCQKLAAQHHTWFYQYENLCHKLQAH
ncbi:SulA-like leucine-rich domain-containing protein [Rheinheimera sp. MMS21-TC3]|uniref:SulA-like leucine-rich domain-containing protein n=1 Tax=Rheinheimera sp. MMS21-TC3 TaxID=3072790 RepID=UPI0028C41CDD|nr:SulA-like leucine-rich domain-containing protein [Rheinheimera sp. MMS21-TC3]WNO60827.1 SulA-like leucine-rich domain-containing protein [Rheinheimera sp. MMS21-TC3]